MTTTVTTPKFAHVVLQTNRLEEMRDWYNNLLAARVVYENPGMCFLTFDEEHHRIALFRPPGPPLAERNVPTVGMQHTAYTFPDLAALLEKFASLREAGIEPYLPVQHGVTTSLYYRDPDSNLVELQVDNFDPDESTAYMMGSEYAQDPIGPSFDPAAMLAALEQGADPAALSTRAWAQSTSDMPHPMTVLATMYEVRG